MKKYFSFLVVAAMLFSAVLVSSCDNDDDNGNGNTSTVSNINEQVQGVGTTQITSVKLMVSVPGQEEEFGEGSVLATGTFSNGRLQITLPTTVAANLLSDGHFGDGVKSNPSARATQAWIIAFNGDEWVGEFELTNQTETVWALLAYVI